MSDQQPKKQNGEIFSLFVAALLIGAVGIYTDNKGFILAGAIFLFVVLVMGINQIRNKE